MGKVAALVLALLLGVVGCSGETPTMEDWCLAQRRVWACKCMDIDAVEWPSDFDETTLICKDPTP